MRIKLRVIINIRKLNVILLKNIYLLLLINEIIVKIKGVCYISLIDYITMFY